MNRNAMIGALATASVLVSGCSTRPRNFTAELSAPVVDRAVFEDDFRTCQALVRQGRKADFKAAAATALATGAGTVGTGAAIASAGFVGIGSTGATLTAAAAAMPVVGVLVGFGVSRAIRSGKEGKYKRAMDACLGEYGYDVSRWSAVKKRDDAAKMAAGKASIQPPEPAIAASTIEPAATPGTATIEQASALEPAT
jgi:hypothetical protein